jgi:restriction system protein
MTLWMVRAGSAGQHMERFLDRNRVYLTWSDLASDLIQIKDPEAMQELLRAPYPQAPPGRIRQNSGQIWAFTREMKIGD